MASIAKVVAAMSAIMWETASCFPTGRPHCTRSLAQTRQISRQVLTVPTELLGMERRPSFKVVRAILRPRPSAPIRFSTGTRTSLKLITALASARRPMKCERRSTFTPGQEVSTTNALIRRVPGCTAITTRSRRGCRWCTTASSRSGRRRSPSGVFSAVVLSRAGSEPTFGSVKAKAEISPLAQRGRYFFF
jgi:hypothetical protein